MLVMGSEQSELYVSGQACGFEIREDLNLPIELMCLFSLNLSAPPAAKEIKLIYEYAIILYDKQPIRSDHRIYLYTQEKGKEITMSYQCSGKKKKKINANVSSA